MAGKIFFKDWQLWQQMTFVLAMCIISVFGLGCGKLWYNNRLMREQEVIDEEKRARYTEMRKAGVPVSSKRGGGGAEIPFGVRAIQGGVEVDGIWISRPATPTTTTTAEQQPKTRMQQQQQSVTTLIGTETTVAAADANKKGKDLVVDDSRSTTEQRGSQSDTSTFFQRVTDAESLASSTTASGTTPRQQSQFAAPKPVPKRKHPRVVNGLNEETLRRLDGYSPTRTTTYETYIPARNNNNNNPRRPSQRSSASSSGESVESSQPRSGAASARSGSGRSYSSSRSSRMMYNNPSSGPRGVPRLDPRPTYTSVPRDSSRMERRETFESVGGTYITGSGEHSPSSLSARDQIPAAPEPTFGPGDLHLNNNTSSRKRVNQGGFEVAPPAGTFGGTPPGGELGTSGGSVEEEDGEVQRGLQPRPPPVERNGGKGGLSYTQALRLENAARNF
ncbi:hypothetical protein GE09DRAFT_458059 [Coniochaeta sp. 2T2.1]|nr:hypothetical protein GE09DRAFT_458059 [Coniochaeta sp. 2T2.1]